MEVFARRRSLCGLGQKVRLAFSIPASSGHLRNFENPKNHLTVTSTLKNQRVFARKKFPHPSCVEPPPRYWFTPKDSGLKSARWAPPLPDEKNPTEVSLDKILPPKFDKHRKDLGQ